MRFPIRVERTQGGWSAALRCAEDAAWLSAPRAIRSTPKGYPHPPVDEPTWWQGDTPPLAASADDDADLRATHLRLVRGEPDRRRNEVLAFGRYLFATLLGSAWLGVIEKAGVQPIELELDLANAGADFAALPWEMMFCTEGPIVGLKTKGRRVAVSRVIRVAAANGANGAVKLEIPLRVLFVVGRQMDHALRPGAEYLALLRKFETQLAMQNGESLGIALHTKLLLSATRDEVDSAIKTFKPAVVHLISHGRRNGTQAEIVLTKMEGTTPSEDAVPAAALAQLLNTSGSVQAVVLNACHTGQPTDAHIAYAAELVTCGIPVAVGMAGQVADSVCRLFTVSFYRALCEELPIPLAVAEGRRAALLQYETHSNNVEWARPVLYLAEGRGTAFSVDRTRKNVAFTAGQLRKRKEILCDRMDHLRDLERVCERAIVNLGIAVGELGADSRGAPRVQLGKTWLLEEMAWMSVLEGYVPCLVESSDAIDPPRSFLDFALQLAQSMNGARRALELPERLRSSALEAVYAELDRKLPDDEAALDAELGGILRGFAALPKVSIHPDSVRRAIGRDLARLLDDARAKIEARGILVLVDDLHRHEGAWQDVLRNATRHGLGNDKAPAPLVFTYSTVDKAGPLVANFLRENSTRFEVRLLQRFREGPERLMAYRQSLLSRNLVPTANPDLQNFVANMFGRFELLTQGIPSYLRMAKLENQLEVDIDNLVLLTSDDHAILRRVREFDGYSD